MKKEKTSKSKKEKLTIKEFKAWFNGVLEMREDNWTPDIKQWKTIIDKINNVLEDVETNMVPQYNSINNQNYNRPNYTPNQLQTNLTIESIIPTDPRFSAPDKVPELIYDINGIPTIQQPKMKNISTNVNEDLPNTIGFDWK